jgi:hypothetical protein
MSHPDEKERLKREILDELKKQDSLKEEIVKELQPVGWGKSISKAIQHPISLLLIGFIFTGVIGTWLSHQWQQREWNRQLELQKKEWIDQQIRVLQTHEIQEKHEMVEQITKSISDNNAAANNLMFQLQYSKFTSLKSEQRNEIMKEYIQAVQNWHVSSALLQQLLNSHYKRQDIRELYLELVDRGDRINYNNSTLIKMASDNNYAENREEIQKVAQDTKLSITVIQDNLQTLVRKMMEEIKSDIEESKR